MLGLGQQMGECGDVEYPGSRECRKAVDLGHDQKTGQP